MTRVFLQLKKLKTIEKNHTASLFEFVYKLRKKLLRNNKKIT